MICQPKPKPVLYSLLSVTDTVRYLYPQTVGHFSWIPGPQEISQVSQHSCLIFDDNYLSDNLRCLRDDRSTTSSATVGIKDTTSAAFATMSLFFLGCRISCMANQGRRKIFFWIRQRAQFVFVASLSALFNNDDVTSSCCSSLHYGWSDLRYNDDLRRL